MNDFFEKYQGLSDEEVQSRINNNQVNTMHDVSTKTYKQIFTKNIFTFFNFLNLALFACVVLVHSYKNGLFVFVIITNTITGIYQEIRAKHILDKISILNKQKIGVIRNNSFKEIDIDEIVIDDFIVLNTGNQVPADCILIDGRLECNESLLTGESDEVNKSILDTIYSGSFVVSGQAICKVIHVGDDNYAQKILIEAKKDKEKNSQLNMSLEKILKIVSILILPLGALLFCKEYFIAHLTLQRSVISTVAAILGMIPSGLVLLTTIALCVSIFKLATQKTLVQELFCIETLARVDTLCFDKTGTITEGKLKVAGYHSLYDEHEFKNIMSSINHYLPNTNITSNALNEYFKPENHISALSILPFSSSRKYSAVSLLDKGTYYIGAKQFLFKDDIHDDMYDQHVSNGHRVIVIGHSETIGLENELPDDLKYVGMIAFEDIIREDATSTLEFFKQQDVNIKIISGDDPVTVSHIAKRVGLDGSDRYLDCSKVERLEDLYDLVENYTIFGRTTPLQKREIIKGLQQHRHVVAMTGDGVNDVMAFKVSDCAIAMASGSDAAKNSAHIVLLENQFNIMPDIVHEGRRVINNITASASLYLMKTIFSVVLASMTIILGHGYPFEPIQLTVISCCCVAMPSFFLTYESNFARVKGDFLKTVFQNSFPFALFIGLCSTALVNGGRLFGFPKEMLTTICVLFTAWSYYCGLRHIYKPMTKYRIIVIYGLQIVLYTCFIFGNNILGLVQLNIVGMVILGLLILISPLLFKLGFIIYEKLYQFIIKKSQ